MNTTSLLNMKGAAQANNNSMELLTTVRNSINEGMLVSEKSKRMTQKTLLTNNQTNESITANQIMI